MRPIRWSSYVIILFAFILSCLPAAAEPISPLAAPPLGERWFSITMGDERAGFVHTTISAAPGGYEVASDSSARMVVLGFCREASSRETYLVNRDLSLKSFVVEQTIAGNPMRLKGEVTAKGIRMTVESAGNRLEKTLKAQGKVFPPPLLNIYPLMQGVKEGKKYRLQMFDAEEVKLKVVTITTLARETLPGGLMTVHLRNDLYPFVDNDVWVDLAGNTVKESVRDGLIVTSTEDGAAARKFIVEAAIAKQEVLRDFSLVRVDRPIARPGELKRMAVEFSGFPEAFPLHSGGGQKAVRLEGGTVLITVENALAPAKEKPSGADLAENDTFPEPVGLMTPDNGELIAKKNEILGEETDPLQRVAKLARWVAANVAENPADSRSPLETLRLRTGNCQSRVLLYVSLARAAGIPTRPVSGLVYVAGKGFLYHSWAESYLGEWLAADPGFGQLPADATHIKLAEGGSADELMVLAGIVGRLKAKVVEESY